MPIDLEAARAHVGLGPSDDDLQTLLEAALEAIEARYGPIGATKREHLRPFGQWVRLGLRAEAVLSVTEGTSALDAADYELWDGGKYVRRLGTSQPVSWTAWVDVTYVPLSEDAQRDRVTLALLDHGLTNPEGLAGITVGPWAEQYQRREPGDVRKDREAIIASMRPATVGTW